MPNRQQETKINKDSYVSIGLLVTVISGVVWITSVSSKSDANQQDIVRLKDHARIQNERYGKIMRSLGRVEGALGTLPKNESLTEEDTE